MPFYCGGYCLNKGQNIVLFWRIIPAKIRILPNFVKEVPASAIWSGQSLNYYLCEYLRDAN